MGSPEVIDLEALLAPIAEDDPAGPSLRDDPSPTSLYYRIKDARTAARAIERQVVWEDEEGVAERPRADWGPVLELAPEALAERSKDLEVACWLVEALVRKHGYAGLRDGFLLLRGLVDRYWDGVHPLPDEDGLATRLAPLAGLNGEASEGVLIQAIYNVPVTAAGTHRPMSVADYRQACELERLDPDARQRRLDQGAADRSMFEQALAETPREQLQAAWEDLGEAAEAFAGLCQVLEQKCGRDERGFSLAPPTSNIRSALEECQDDFRAFARDLLGLDAAAEASALAESDGGGLVVAAGGQGGVAGQRMESRDEALRALLQVADFFRRTEPHSPISYALEQAVRWGRMSLPELLTELIPDESSREQLFKLVGIRPPKEPDE